MYEIYQNVFRQGSHPIDTNKMLFKMAVSAEHSTVAYVTRGILNFLSLEDLKKRHFYLYICGSLKTTIKSHGFKATRGRWAMLSTVLSLVFQLSSENRARNHGLASPQPCLVSCCEANGEIVYVHNPGARKFAKMSTTRTGR